MVAITALAGCPGDDAGGTSEADSTSTSTGSTDDGPALTTGEQTSTTTTATGSTTTDATGSSSSDGASGDETDTLGCVPGTEDCECAGGACDPGLACVDDQCVSPVCGDGVAQGPEACDDGNMAPGDGCSEMCEAEVPAQVEVGLWHSCVVFSTGSVRCWGRHEGERLGNGATEPIGDDEPAGASALVSLGGEATQVSIGAAHSCAVLESGAVRCWGSGASGRLGYGDTDDVALPSDAGDVPLGGAAVQVSAGEDHTCVVLDTGAVRCWGAGGSGRLGYGNFDTIGDDEDPSTAGDVDLGGTAVQVVAASSFTCALLDDGAVRCWGSGPGTGYGTGLIIGDDETPASVGDVPMGGSVDQIAGAGGNGGGRICALMSTGSVRCWGSSAFSPLGYGDYNDIGLLDTPADAGDIDLGGTAVEVAVGPFHQCARLDSGSMRCWGLGSRGRLGYANTDDVGGFGLLPAGAGDIDVGADVLAISARGGAGTCALVVGDAVRCWGGDTFGAHGYGFTGDIGDNETPSTVGDLPVF